MGFKNLLNSVANSINISDLTKSEIQNLEKFNSNQMKKAINTEDHQIYSLNDLMVLSQLHSDTPISKRDDKPLTIENLYHNLARLVTKIHNITEQQQYILNKMISLEVLYDLQFLKVYIHLMIQKILNDNLCMDVIKYKIEFVRDDKEIIQKIQEVVTKSRDLAIPCKSKLASTKLTYMINF